MKEFKKQWDLDMAMTVLAHKTVDSETWAEAVEWLMLYGPSHIQDMLNQASHLATSEHFPELKPTGYSPDGTPLYDIEALATALNISPDEVYEKLRAKEQEQQARHLFGDDDAMKVH